MFQYACIYLHKQSSAYARILNVSNAEHSLRSLYKLLSSYQQTYLERCQTGRQRFAKRIMLESGSLGHFDKHFVKNTRKKTLEFFLVDALKTSF